HAVALTGGIVRVTKQGGGNFTAAFLGGAGLGSGTIATSTELTVDGYAFTASLTGPSGAIAIDEANSTHSFTATATLTGTVTTGMTWALTLDTTQVLYTAKDGDTLDLAASGLAASIVRAAAGFSAVSGTVGVLTITKIGGA